MYAPVLLCDGEHHLENMGENELPKCSSFVWHAVAASTRLVNATWAAEIFCKPKDATYQPNASASVPQKDCTTSAQPVHE